MPVAYGSAVILAFVLSLSNNNNVRASISRNNYSYDLMEDSSEELMELLESQESSLNNMPEEEYSPKQEADASENSLFRNVLNKVIAPSVEKTVQSEVTVQKGDSFISILNNQGLKISDAHHLYNVLKKVYNPSKLKIGQKISITSKVDSYKQELLSIENITIEPKVGLRYVLKKDEDAKYIALEIKDELLDEVNSAYGSIDGPLSTSMRKHDVPNRIINEFTKIFAYTVDFRREIKKGDRFEIIYENKITPDGQVVKSGDILYASLSLRNQKFALYRFKDANGNVGYFDEKGQAMKKVLHRKPMSFQQARISSPFGKRRHPIKKRWIIHWGVDYAAPKGTKIFAGGDGVIQTAKYNGGYGNYIKIRHNSEYSTAYGHMWKFAKGIRPGVRVKQGQLIGYVGSTGLSTGPHLHYEVIRNGKRVNPLTIKAATGENLGGKNLKKFKRIVADIKQSYNKMFAEGKKAKEIKLSQN